MKLLGYEFTEAGHFGNARDYAKTTYIHFQDEKVLLKHDNYKRI